ncbi:MAG TPA: hypothetical protein VFU15_16680 [Bacteroidia bacterium]|nr:hypothetical protein [Bacteroidia bacterium]
MKKTQQYFLAFCLLAISSGIRAQNTSCSYPQFFCTDTSFAYSHHGKGESCSPSPLYLWYYFQVPDTITSVTVSCAGGMTGCDVWGPIDSLTDACSVSSPVLFSSASSTTSYTVNDGTQIPPGYYYMRLKMSSCESTVSFTVNGGYLECEQVPCDNCIGSFAPEPGKKYLVSVWVKEAGAAVTKTSYDHPQVYIDFPGTAVTYGPFTASGQIIDGWQRVEAEFVVPNGATKIDVKLDCTSGDCYFDDLRIYPFDGSMKTYVYDPVTMRLVAELDERNYATFYEYDEEGKLIRIKKETERGIMTIQESKTSLIKQ